MRSRPDGDGILTGSQLAARTLWFSQETINQLGYIAENRLSRDSRTPPAESEIEAASRGWLEALGRCRTQEEDSSKASIAQYAIRSTRFALKSAGSLRGHDYLVPLRGRRPARAREP